MIRGLLLLLFASSCFAAGPLYRHKDGRVDQEFENVYQDIRGARSLAKSANDSAATALTEAQTVGASTPTVTAWTAYTPTGGWTTNVTYTGFWRRVGDTMEIQFLILCSGAPDNATPSVVLPGGHAIDTSKLLGTTNNESPLSGQLQIVDDGGALYMGRPLYNSTSEVRFRFEKDNGTSVGLNDMADNATPFTFGADDYMQGSFSVPISGWTATN